MGWSRCMPSVSHTPLVPFHSCSAECKTTTQVLWLPIQSHWRLPRRLARALVQRRRIQAINASDYLFTAIKSPAATGDYSIFIPISAGFFFLYWIANFVVPDMIAKDLSKEDSGEKQVRKERIASEEEKRK